MFLPMSCDFEGELVSILKLKLSSLGLVDLFDSWTVIAAIFAFNSKTKCNELLSIGTGVKCIPDEKIRNHSLELVHDLHAETICRRSFLFLIYKNIIEIISNKSERNDHIVYDSVDQKYVWNPDLELIFYSSQTPCNK